MKGKALFLDRDGVVNYDYGYVHSVKNLEFIEGIFDICKIAKALDYSVIIITNQSGIGRGYYSEETFRRFMEYILSSFDMRGVTITDYYYCPYHSEKGIGKFKKESYFRKPNPGMIYKAAFDYSISLPHSLLIADKMTDIEAGNRAGIGRNILLNRKSLARKGNIEHSEIKELHEVVKFFK